jgi:hypothetical protein
MLILRQDSFRKVLSDEIEKVRHKNLPEHKRICTLCDCEVEDEIHFLMRCTKLKTFRENHLGLNLVTKIGKIYMINNIYIISYIY